jgi:hypothetical protein
MKKIIALSILLSLLIACTKENATPETPVDENIDTTTTIVQHMGNFVNGPWGTVSGSAEIRKELDGEFILALKDMKISNGPDLHVYLSKEVQPVNFIDLGRLKSTVGNQVYNITGSPDFKVYKYALIHCQQYNHLFGSTELK